jgi:glutamyl-tRNA reductase
MTSQLSIAGATFAHPDVDTLDRAPLSLDGDRLREALARVAGPGVDVFVLSTCLRVEVVTTGCDRALDRVLHLLYPDVSLPRPVVRRDVDGLEHLTRIAAGLESPVVGEQEVLGQMRAAIDVGREAGTIGGVFGRILEAAVAEARAARKTLATSAAGSMALVAADVADGADRVAVFGAGKMAHAATDLLRSKGTEVTVYARRPGAVAFDVDHVRSIDDAPSALATFPVVISATSAKRELFASDVLDRALDRRTRPLTLIDLAMPPDFAPAADPERLVYLNLDGLADHVRRVQAPAAVERRIADAVATRWTRLENHHEVGPVIAAMLDEANRAVSEEVRRFAGRLEATPDQIRVLEQLANTVAHRVLHRPLSFLSSSEHGADAAPLCAEMFGVAGDH